MKSEVQHRVNGFIFYALGHIYALLKTNDACLLITRAVELRYPSAN